MYYILFYFNESSYRASVGAFKQGPFSQREVAVATAKNMQRMPHSVYQFFDIVKE